MLQLYDLHTGPYAKGENHRDGCPKEDLVCGVNSAEGSKCGTHGTCEVTDLGKSQYRCTCDSGYRARSNEQPVCDTGKTLNLKQLFIHAAGHVPMLVT